MKNRYSKLNKKLRFAAVLKCALLAFALGMITFSAIVIGYKVVTLQPDMTIAAGAGALTAIAVFAIAFAINFPTEKRIAKKLDSRLAMNEKIQTMVEFKNEQGDMFQIQREDTENKLGETPKKNFRNKKAWVNAVLPLIAAIALVASLSIPVRPASTPVDPGTLGESDVWALTEWQITAVKELIDEVKASSLAEEGKTDVVESLETMLEDLGHVTSKTKMKQTVIAVMVDISKVANELNSFSTIIGTLKISDNNHVKMLSEAIGSPADPIIEGKYQSLRVSFPKENYSSSISAFASALESAVKLSGVTGDDAFYAALADFAKNAAEYSAGADQLGDAEKESGLTTVFEKAAEKISNALDQQNINRSTCDNANERLMEIFEIQYAELPEELRSAGSGEAGTEKEDYNDKKEDDIVHSGGLGGGEILYGSNDEIYDRDSESHVQYGSVINDYDVKKATELNERPLSDEMKEMIEDYFESLFHSGKK